MILDMSSILKFLALYFIFCILQYTISLLSSIFDVLAAYFAVLLVEFQEKLSNEKEKEQEEDCIGFKISSDDEGEEDEE